MTREAVLELIAEGIDRMVGDIEASGVDKSERFGVAFRALERGVERIDEFGNAITNEPAPQSEDDLQKQIGWFYSGPIQAAVAAGVMLRHLPDLPRGVTMEVFSSRN